MSGVWIATECRNYIVGANNVSEVVDFKLLSTREIENIVDKGLRHKSSSKPIDFLRHWLWVARHFGYATRDESWGEFEKEFAIIIKRLVVAERELEALKATRPVTR